MGKLRHRAGRAASALLVGCAMLALLLRPNDAISYAKDGLKLCADVIIPSLFPFFVLSQMIVELGFAKYVGAAFERVMRPLFGVSGACATALALGFVGGYPTGAKTAISLYEGGLCTRTEAERMLAFCNNSGPAFILGVVGAGVFGSSGVGLLLYLAHAVASILVGIVFRFWGRNSAASDSRLAAPSQAVGLAPAFANSMAGALSSTLAICAFVIFFTVVIKMLYLTGAIPFVASIAARLPFVDETTVRQLLTGLIEISSGVWSLKGAAVGMRTELALAAFMLGWAGLSVHCQVLSFIGRSGLSTKTYILGKLLHGAISAALVWCVSGALGLAKPVSAYLAEQVAGAASMTLPTALAMSAGGAVIGVGWLWLGCALHKYRKKGL